MKRGLIEFYDKHLGAPGLDKIVAIGTARLGLHQPSLIRAAIEVYEESAGESPESIGLGHRVFARARVIETDRIETYRKRLERIEKRIEKLENPLWRRAFRALRGAISAPPEREVWTWPW